MGNQCKKLKICQGTCDNEELDLSDLLEDDLKITKSGRELTNLV